MRGVHRGNILSSHEKTFPVAWLCCRPLTFTRVISGADDGRRGGQVKFHACLESISVAAQCAAGGAVRFIHFPTLNAATHSGERSGLFFASSFVAAKFPLREKSSF